MGLNLQGEMSAIVVAGVIANGALTPDIPAGYVIRRVYLRNTTANAVTGGINIGTTSLGNDVVAALAVVGNAFALIPLTSVLKTAFSATASQTLFISAVGAWNSASVDVVIQLDRAIV